MRFQTDQLYDNEKECWEGKKYIPFEIWDEFEIVAHKFIFISITESISNWPAKADKDRFSVSKIIKFWLFYPGKIM